MSFGKQLLLLSCHGICYDFHALSVWPYDKLSLGHGNLSMVDSLLATSLPNLSD